MGSLRLLGGSIDWFGSSVDNPLFFLMEVECRLRKLVANSFLLLRGLRVLWSVVRDARRRGIL